MNYWIDQLAFYLPLVCFSLLIILILAKYGGSFPVRVNCWFCNQTTVVQFSTRNSWVCPACEQYNGFDAEGNYNVDLPAQYNVCETTPNTLTDNVLTNGLCEKCNLNQLSKVQHLAEFTAVDDCNYDIEFEIYKNELEKVYELCNQCNLHVTKTLHQQQSWFFNQTEYKLHQLPYQKLRTKGQINVKQIFIKLLHFMIITMILYRIASIIPPLDSFIAVLNTVAVNMFLAYKRQLDIASDSLTKVLTTQINNSIIETILDIFWEQIDMFIAAVSYAVSYIPINVQIFVKRLLFTDWLSAPGFVLQVFRLCLNRRNFIFQFSSSSFWLLTSYFFNYEHSAPYIFYLQFTAAVLTLISTLYIHHRSPYADETFIKSNLKDFLNSKITINQEKTCNASHSTNSAKKSSRVVIEDNFTKTFSTNNNISNNIPVHSDQRFTHLFGQTPILNQLDQSGSISSSINNKIKFLTEQQQKISPEKLHSSQSECDENLDNLKALQIGKAKEPYRQGNPHFTCKTYNVNKLPELFSRKSKKVLSPPRLRNVSQASWVAGGYWKPTKTDLTDNPRIDNCPSRSSSLSSGFGSQVSENHQTGLFKSATPYNSLPSSRDNSISGEYDRFSALSEPAYYFNMAAHPLMKTTKPYQVTPLFSPLPYEAYSNSGSNRGMNEYRSFNTSKQWENYRFSNTQCSHKPYSMNGLNSSLGYMNHSAMKPNKSSNNSFSNFSSFSKS